MSDRSGYLVAGRQLDTRFPAAPDGSRWAVSILALIAAVALALPAWAQQVRITDGDTIKLNGTKYRLWGIDAPEKRQACSDGWAAGRAATAALERLMAGHTITCEPRDRDRYRRIVALCRADGQDLGAAMVRAGMAWAFVKYSGDYIDQEDAAVADNLGVHLHACEKAWLWRAARHR
jgi:endonuclease YncB( thermonuclease family)